MTNKRILFLDVDGVLNSTRTDTATHGIPHDLSEAARAHFDWIAVGLIRELCKHEDTSIVLSSDWRYMHSTHAIANFFDLPVCDVTPKLDDCRGAEIQRWLNQHPGVEHYAIVDDQTGMLAVQKDHFVQTDQHEGLSYADFRALQRILNGQLGGKHHHALFWD
jgi:hypothetical protein